jgi:hypothetical protein
MSMSVPMRKDDLEEDLTTADLAKGKRPAASSAPSEDRPGPVLAEHPTSERVSEKRQEATSAPNKAETAPLFPNNELEDLRRRWNDVQGTFVDEPRRAVEQADGLVASAMKRLAEVFAEERSKLEQQWDRGDNVSTEDLRLALQRYRSFFHRLLSV